MKDIAYGANQIPGAGGAPGVVQPIVAAFSILEERIKQLSIKLMIERENMTLMNDRIKELENKSCCKTEDESTKKPTKAKKGTTGKAKSGTDV